MTSRTICDICDDDGCDWADDANVGPVYHRSCVERRAAHPNNERERRGLTNTLRFGVRIACAKCNARLINPAAGNICPACEDATIAHARETLRAARSNHGTYAPITECPCNGSGRRPCGKRATVRRATLFDGVIDTFLTETELNGWKPTQGTLL